jgi:hypothetical protein
LFSLTAISLWMRPACSLMSSVIGRESSQIQEKGVIIVKFLVKHITMYPQLITLGMRTKFRYELRSSGKICIA